MSPLPNVASSAARSAGELQSWRPSIGVNWSVGFKRIVRPAKRLEPEENTGSGEPVATHNAGDPAMSQCIWHAFCRTTTVVAVDVFHRASCRHLS
jgi:hypothetical protein